MKFKKFHKITQKYLEYATEYMDGCELYYHEDDSGFNGHTLDLVLTMPYGDKKRTVPLGINSDGNVAITFPDDTWLGLRELYVYLWHESESELGKVTNND